MNVPSDISFKSFFLENLQNFRVSYRNFSKDSSANGSVGFLQNSSTDFFFSEIRLKICSRNHSQFQRFLRKSKNPPEIYPGICLENRPQNPEEI